MKLEYGIITTVGVSVCISLVLIANNPSEVVSYSGLEKLNQDAKDAKWWSEGLIPSEEFVRGLQFLVKSGVIRV